VDFAAWKEQLAARFGEEGKMLALLSGVENAEEFIDVCRPLTNKCDYTLAVINRGLTTRVLRKLRTDCPAVDRRLLSQWMSQFVADTVDTADTVIDAPTSSRDSGIKEAERIALVSSVEDLISQLRSFALTQSPSASSVNDLTRFSTE
jgi:hypothetical protein